MDILTVSQVIFNFTVTIAILVVSLIVAMIAYEILMAIKVVKKVSKDINERSAEALRYVNSLMASIAVMPLISNFFKKKSRKKEEN